MISERQQKFRDEFRETIPDDYHGVSHGLTALAIGTVAIAIFLWLVRAPIGWLDWAMIPLVVVGWNFMEWGVHTYILHRPRKNKIARALYMRHTLTHHQFFTHEDAEFESTRDFSIVFFPLFALPATLVLAAPFGLAAWLAISANAALLMMASVTFMYVLFEVMHFCAHAPENSFVRHFPLINTMRRHHIAHHNHRLMMEKNMNFTLPLADWVMGTCDVERGLVGTVFNGYSEQHLSKETQKVRSMQGARGRRVADGA